MSRFEIIVTKSAAKDIKKLDNVVRKRLKRKLEFYLEQENPLAFAEHLTDPAEGDYRFRIGNYRAVFDVDGSKLVLLRVRHRSEVYKS